MNEEVCAGCGKELEQYQVLVDAIPCEECDARLCDKCACAGTLGGDSYPSVYCPVCLPKHRATEGLRSGGEG